MADGNAFNEIRAAAQVILDVCASRDEAQTRLERVRYASKLIGQLATEAAEQFQTEQADGGQR